MLSLCLSKVIIFLYVESISNLIHNVKNKTAPTNIQNLFRNVSDVHSYNTRSAAAGNFYIMHSRLELYKSRLSPDSEQDYGTAFQAI